MKLYKDTNGVYWADDKTIPAAQYRLYANESRTEITLTPFDGDFKNRLTSYYNIVVTDVLKEDDNPYSGFDEFYTALSGLFSNEVISKVSSSTEDPVYVNGLPQSTMLSIEEVDFDNSDFTGWTGDPTELFKSPFSTSITNASGDNPKSIVIAFNRSITSIQVGLGENNGGDFSNIKVSAIGSGGFERSISDFSSDNTKLTSKNIKYDNEVFNSIKLEFNTSDPVSLSNIAIQKSNYNSTQIQGKTPDDEFVNFSASRLGNFNVALAEYQGDAFGRLRVSEPYTIFDNSLTSASSDTLFWSELTNGTGSGVYTNTNSCYDMSVATSGDYVVRQTPQRFKYQPGKSHEVLLTGLFNTDTDVIKRAGLCDYDNKGLGSITNAPQNGIFFENNSGVLSWNIANNGVITESVTQDSWSVDKFDGNGTSGFNLDPSSTLILFTDLEWLGVGTVRCGFVVDGEITVCHEFHHANNSFINVYMRTANLPISYAMTSTGGSGSMKQICSSVISEGGFNPKGIFRAVYNATGATVAADGKESILGIRLRPEEFEYGVEVDSVSTLAGTSGDGIWLLLYNPTLDGTPTWTNVVNSNIQFSTDNFDVLDDGVVFAAGTYSSDNDASSSPVESALRIGKDLAGNLDEMWLCVLSFTAETLHGTIRFRETF